MWPFFLSMNDPMGSSAFCMQALSMWALQRVFRTGRQDLLQGLPRAVMHGLGKQLDSIMTRLCEHVYRQVHA